MRKFLHVWRSIGASSFVLSVIESGYKLPFVSIPLRYFFSNHKSAVDNRAFVCEAIELLLLAGSAVEVKRDQVHVCSPLGVVPKKNGKLRLILDLRFLNKHLAKRKFKFEDLRVVAEFLQPGDWFLLSIFVMATIMLTFFKSIGSIWLFRLLSMVSHAIFCFVRFLLV